MKILNELNKIFLLLMLIIITNSCAVNQRLWDNKTGYEKIESFFIDNNNKRVVLIGEGGYATKLGTRNYSITSLDDEIFKIFEMGIKSGSEISFNIDVFSTWARGEKFYGKSTIFFKRNKLSDEEWKYLNKFNTNLKKKEGNFSYRFWLNEKTKYTQTNTIRYPSSQEKAILCEDDIKETGDIINDNIKITKNQENQTKNPENNCINVIKFKNPWQGTVSEYDTWPQTFKKLALTPFALAGDLLMMPIYTIAFIAQAIGSK